MKQPVKIRQPKLLYFRTSLLLHANPSFTSSAAYENLIFDEGLSREKLCDVKTVSYIFRNDSRDRRTWRWNSWYREMEQLFDFFNIFDIYFSYIQLTQHIHHILLYIRFSVIVILYILYICQLICLLEAGSLLCCAFWGFAWFACLSKSRVCVKRVHSWAPPCSLPAS